MNDELFDIERARQRMLISLDETTRIMHNNAAQLLERGNQIEHNESASESLLHSSKRVYWSAMPWYKRWLLCCFS